MAFIRQNTDAINSKQNKQIATKIYQNKSEVQGQKNPPARVADAEGRMDPVALGGAAAIGNVEPRTPALDAVRRTETMSCSLFGID